MRRLVAALAALPLVGAAAVAAGGSPAATATLVATVGPDFTIGLADSTGKRVDVLTAGTYTIEVRDRSAEHNFKLANKPDGLRVNIDSGVEFVGVRTFTVELAPGRYAYACSPHWQTMNGDFVVTPASAPVAIAAIRISPGAPRPKAGAVYRLRGVSLALDDGTTARPSALSASARIGTRLLPRAGAGLAWRIPATERGKLLALTITATHASGRKTQTLRLRIA